MNEFQAILTVITLFALRFALPAVALYGFARLVRHIAGPDPDAADTSPTPRSAH